LSSESFRTTLLSYSLDKPHLFPELESEINDLAGMSQHVRLLDHKIISDAVNRLFNQPQQYIHISPVPPDNSSLIQPFLYIFFCWGGYLFFRGKVRGKPLLLSTSRILLLLIQAIFCGTLCDLIRGKSKTRFMIQVVTTVTVRDILLQVYTIS